MGLLDTRRGWAAHSTPLAAPLDQQACASVAVAKVVASIRRQHVRNDVQTRAAAGVGGARGSFGRDLRAPHLRWPARCERCKSGQVHHFVDVTSAVCLRTANRSADGSTRRGTMMPMLPDVATLRRTETRGTRAHQSQSFTTTTTHTQARPRPRPRPPRHTHTHASRCKAWMADAVLACSLGLAGRLEGPGTVCSLPPALGGLAWKGGHSRERQEGTGTCVWVVQCREPAATWLLAGTCQPRTCPSGDVRHERRQRPQLEANMGRVNAPSWWGGHECRGAAGSGRRPGGA